MDDVKNEESWNKTRIFIAFFLIALLAVGAYFFKIRFLDANLSPKEGKSVKGVSLEDKGKNNNGNMGIDVQGAVKEKLNDLKQEVLDLNIAEEAAKLSHSSDLSLVDSIIAATCKLNGCDALLSGDTDYNPLIKKKYLKVTSW